ncbi:MAG: AI-2E family transporter [Acidobacteria bacterium]|nr:AI-2E family transporter [Acidobacteriota bacterium]
MVVIALVLTVYLLIEWEATLEWLIAFVPASHRQKFRRTIAESRVIVFHYVVGNVITSVITIVATFSVLVALQVPAALVGVIVFYIVFNAVESYFINPRVYGHELKMSKLAVLIAVAVGGQLAGVMGALLALPVAAIYPTIERIWLRERLGGDTVDKQQRLSA